MKVLLTVLVILNGNEPRIASMHQSEVSSMEVCVMAGKIAISEITKSNETRWYTRDHSATYRCDQTEEDHDHQ